MKLNTEINLVGANIPVVMANIQTVPTKRKNSPYTKAKRATKKWTRQELVGCAHFLSGDMSVDIWKFEGQLYPMIAAGMKGERKIKKRFELGDGYKTEVAITKIDGKPFKNHEVVDANTIKIRVHFWKDNIPIYRIDSAHGFVHCHVGRDQEFKKRLSLEPTTIAQLVSATFEEAKTILRDNFSVDLHDTDPVPSTF